jgi:hypothetical protein
MFDETVKNVWKRGETGAPPLSRAAIEELLRPAARRTGRALETLVWTLVAMLALSALLAAVNLYGYRANPSMLAVEGALAAVCGVFAALGVRLSVELRRIARADRPLMETVERRLAIYERWFEPWLLVAAATPWLFTLAINTLIDNDHGVYRINHPWEFAVVTAAMLGIMYAALRLSLIPTVREMRAVLHDLRTDAIDETPVIEGVRRRAKIWTVIGVVLLAVAVGFTVMLWLGVF